MRIHVWIPGEDGPPGAGSKRTNWERITVVNIWKNCRKSLWHFRQFLETQRNVKKGKRIWKKRRRRRRREKYRIRSQDVLDGGSGLRMAAAIRHVTWYLEWSAHCWHCFIPITWESARQQSGLSCCCHVVLTEYPMRLWGWSLRRRIPGGVNQDHGFSGWAYRMRYRQCCYLPCRIQRNFFRLCICSLHIISVRQSATQRSTFLTAVFRQWWRESRQNGICWVSYVWGYRPLGGSLPLPARCRW